MTPHVSFMTPHGDPTPCWKTLILKRMPNGFVDSYISNNLFFFFLSSQVYVVVGIAGVALTGCILMVIILKYGRNSKFGLKGELIFLKE